MSFTFDFIERITGATGTPNSNYNVSGITYDKNGNIQTLNRNGWQNSSSYADMDILHYTYYDSSNKLKKVLDTGNKIYGFKDSNNAYTEYTYDVNGNMKTDLNKEGMITDITYNYLNLPVNVTLAGGTINYTYDATGNKLRKITNSTTTEYAGNYKYVNGVLEFFTPPAPASIY